MKLTIDRKTWLRGKGSGFSGLFREGRRCCLGFLGRACGIADVELNKPMPSGTHLRVRDLWPEWLFEGHFNSNDATALSKLNDDRTTSEADREQKLAVEFARHGVEVEFVG